MFLGRSLQGSVSLLNDTGVEAVRSLSQDSPNSSSHSSQQQDSEALATTLQYQAQSAQPRPYQSEQLSVSDDLSNSFPSQSQPDLTAHDPTEPSAGAKASVPRTGAALEKKRPHICPTCSKAFTTSGHLARHTRIHTGERNHKCPFPGCETRCSRQDNLQQQ